MRALLLTCATVIVLADATAASAQTNDDWSGPYFGGRLGYSSNVEDKDETILFDTDLNGAFDDTVTTSGGADAFSSGFCGGSAVSARQTSCADRSGTEWSVHAGYDIRFGSIVVGIVGEYGNADIRDGVTAFSTTPAFYTLQRNVDDTAAIRARAGLLLGNTLVYGTGGLAYAKVRSRFTTSNGINDFTSIDDNNKAYGYRVGGGIERRFGPNFGLGLQYLYTDVEDEDFRVRAGGVRAPISNPFILTNPDGTDFRRSDDRMDWHNLSVVASFHF